MLPLLPTCVPAAVNILNHGDKTPDSVVNAIDYWEAMLASMNSTLNCAIVFRGNREKCFHRELEVEQFELTVVQMWESFVFFLSLCLWYTADEIAFNLIVQCETRNLREWFYAKVNKNDFIGYKLYNIAYNLFHIFRNKSPIFALNSFHQTKVCVNLGLFLVPCHIVWKECCVYVMFLAVLIPVIPLCIVVFTPLFTCVAIFDVARKGCWKETKSTVTAISIHAEISWFFYNIEHGTVGFPQFSRAQLYWTDRLLNSLSCFEMKLCTAPGKRYRLWRRRRSCLTNQIVYSKSCVDKIRKNTYIFPAIFDERFLKIINPLSSKITLNRKIIYLFRT